MDVEDKDYISRILKNDESAMQEVYNKLSASFHSFFDNYGLPKVELEDIFQDTIVAFYQNVMKGKLKVQDASIKTYIWSIGKHKIIDVLRKNKIKKRPIPEDKVEALEIRQEVLSVQQKKLYAHFKNLGKKCQKILKYFYYEGLTINEIVELGQYKDANTVKSSKSRCIKQLRKLVNNT